MPNLQDHMLRVAGVATLIVENFENPLDKKPIISACLLHDMGNIVKFNSEWNEKNYPHIFNQYTVQYWENVKKEFIEKYGDKEYLVTYKILKEIGIPNKIFDLIMSMEFINIIKAPKIKKFETKICLYSDARVSPREVTSLSKRLAEVKERFIKNKGISIKQYELLTKAAFKIEKQIFAHSKIKPEDITEEKIKPLIKKLRSFEIESH